MSQNTRPDGTKRIHFISDVEDYGAAYECKRCGYRCGFEVKMYEHRKGLISHCFRSRLHRKLRSLLPGVDRDA